MAEDLGTGAAPPGAAPAPPPPTDVAGAQSRKAELMADSAWRDRYFAGNVEARSEMASLNATIVAVASSNGPDAVVTAFSVERGRELGLSDAVLDQVKNQPPVSQQEYEAVARHKRELLSDKSFVEKLSGGDYDARRKMFLANLVLSSPIKPAA